MICVIPFIRDDAYFFGLCLCCHSGSRYIALIFKFDEHMPNYDSQFSAKPFFFLLFWMLLGQLNAQTLPIPRNLQKAYDQGTRSISGQPGAKYWQNKADYDIYMAFSPLTRLVSGTVVIVYTNDSPDTLREILFKLYPNLYAKNAQRLMPIEAEDAGDGMKIETLSANGVAVKNTDYKINSTNMSVRGVTVAPKETIKFKISYSYTLNKDSHIRTGQVDAGAWFVAYFFPRIAVYDDVEGWNRNQYLGTQEFYNDFCDFKAAIKVPKDYLVWATGNFVNSKEVLTAKYADRLAKAEQSDALMYVIDSLDLKEGYITAQGPTNTFRFEANHVTDLAVAISNHNVWQSTSLVVDNATKRRTRVDAVFNKDHKDYYEVLSDARKTVESMSFRFPKWPFPYNHLTVFDGLDQMEYPMMVNDNPLSDHAESIELTDHEIFHTMFPFYMGINETKYGWMDEGWATIGEWLISPMIDSSIVDEYGMNRYEKLAGTEYDLPIMTLTTQLNGPGMMINSYPKPGLGYLYVKDMLGDDLFFKGLHLYFKTWNGKHPIPFDFFNCMNEGSGVNLNWFWKTWFFDNGVPDLAIAHVNERKSTITIESKGNKPTPIDLTLTFEDKSTLKVHRSIEVWKEGAKTVEVKYASSKKISAVHLGSTYTADIDKKNNDYPTTNK